MRIVYFIHRDRKFTAGFINFMKMYFPEYEQYFIIKDNGHEEYPLQLVDDNNVILVRSYRAECIFPNQQIMELLYSADKIIVSQVAHVLDILVNFDSALLGKTYLQYWGGNFCEPDTPETQNIGGKSEKARLFQKNLWECARKCRGNIFLADDECDLFKKITGIEGPCYVAPVPPDPKTYYEFLPDFVSKMAPKQRNETYRIMVGHSSNYGMYQIEMLDMLYRFRDKPIEIYCPLSYGSEENAACISQRGKELFGNKFIPLYDFMPYEEYAKLLSTFDIGIFGQKLQFGLANISLMLRMGKKVYLRPESIVWNCFGKKHGMKIYSTETIKTLSFEEFVHQDPDAQRANREIYLREDGFVSPQAIRAAWKRIFELE